MPSENALILAERAEQKGLSVEDTDWPAASAPSWEEDSYASRTLYEMTDRAGNAALARLTAGLSPRALLSAYFDWAAGLAFAPGKRALLADKALRKSLRLGTALMRAAADPLAPPPEIIEPLPQDRRFRHPGWRHAPYAWYYQSFLLAQQWWHNASTGVPGVLPESERAIAFAARQIMDMWAPSNLPWLNPEVTEVTVKSGGTNLVNGLHNLLEDWQRAAAGKPPVGTEAFRVGKDVATTPGKVVYRNALIELIQYAPSTEVVRPEPVLIVPAWIMKFYILDLSPHNSLVRYLRDRGFTVFMISWKNPTAADREMGMEDYLKLGPLAALREIGRRVPAHPVHLCGYCLGGTLAAIAAAVLAREKADGLASLSLFAAQIDFEEAGELMLFINEKQVRFLEDMMWEQGYLDTRQMAGTFQLLRSNDLIWSRMVREYLLGERAPMTDMTAWNADLTRMPFRMHSEYLRRLFLHNDLAERRYRACGGIVMLSDIRVPIFAVSTERDHVAPWRSVFHIAFHTSAETTFVLATGGHNVGIVAEPAPADAAVHPKKGYRIGTMPADMSPCDPDAWRDSHALKSGSWWPAWADWLAARSGASTVPPVTESSSGIDSAGAVAAPGRYVRAP